MKSLLALLLVVFVGACATTPVETYSAVPFDEAEYAALPTTGTALVRGQVLGITGGGEVKQGAGVKVVMFPATEYGNQRYAEQILGGKLLNAPPDLRYMKNVFSRITDGDGRFEFADIPPGRYYIYSEITWVVDHQEHGGLVVRKIDVENGAVTEALLNR